MLPTEPGPVYRAALEGSTFHSGAFYPPDAGPVLCKVCRYPLIEGWCSYCDLETQFKEKPRGRKR